jgi:hypothetical protein
MRKAESACVLALAGALVSATLRAEDAPPAKYKVQPLNLHREQFGTEALGELGRTRMRSGDCVGALQAFDEALRTTFDAALRRDRGLCHENLGHAYPAIDDYRAYLTAAPEATDAEGIHQRLVKLEQDTAGYSSASTDAPGDVEGGASARGKASMSTSARGRPQLDYVEREDDPLQVPLRRGRGWSFGPIFSVRKWSTSPARIALPGSNAGSGFGDSSTWAESVGLDVRASLGPSGAIIFEVAYEHFNSTLVDSAIVSGLSALVGYEWRFPLDAEYHNQLFLAPGLGFEHLAVQPGDATSGGVSLGGFVPRVRLGWRHLLAQSAGLDVSLDGGVANFFQYGNFPYDKGGTTGLVALNLVLLWGL